MLPTNRTPESGVGYGARLRAALGSAPSPDAPRLGVVVVNYGSHRLLAENLPVGVGTAAGARIVVVDNFSTDAERSEIRALAADRHWDVVAPDDNLGFGEGVNRGVLRGAELGCRVFVSLNPDAVAEPAVLAGLAAAAEASPRALVSPLVVRPDGHPFFRGSTINMRTGRIRTGWVAADDDPDWKNWLSGACLAFNGQAFAELGGFADGYFLYWEDVDLSRRAAALGLKLLLCPDLAVTHDEGGTHTARNSRAKSPLYYFYNARNRLVFAARLADPRDRRRWLASTPRESLRIWLRGGRRQLFTQPQGMMAAIHGMFAGLREYRRTVRTRAHPSTAGWSQPG